MVGSLDGLFACLAGLGEIPDRLTRFGGLPATAASIQVGSGLPGLGQGGFHLAQGGGPIRQADADDGVSSQGRFGMQEGGDASLPVGRQGLEVLAGESG